MLRKWPSCVLAGMIIVAASRSGGPTLGGGSNREASTDFRVGTLHESPFKKTTDFPATVFHPIGRDAERSELKRAFCSSLSSS